MEKIFNDFRGVILFLLVVGILSFLFTMRIYNLNIAENEKTKTIETYYA
ncbi:MAG: hypothetical protein IJB82_00730 [Bacilli bacterium]|nr:hypothetical protein [Bacilli bacterium]